MKVIFDYQIFCLQKHGGISRYFSELAHHMMGKCLQDARIFAPVYINKYCSSVRAVHPNGIEIPELAGFGRATSWAASTVLTYISLKSLSTVDIFHETYYSGIDCCPRSAKRVITIHDMTYERFSDQFPNKNRMRELKALAARRADHVVCVSENTQKDVIEFLGISKDKTSVIYHGHSFDPHLEIKPFITDRPYILFVGKRDGYKNFDALLRVYAHSSKLSETHLLICFGGGEFSNEEHRLIKLLGVQESNIIQISGDDELLARLYDGADVFVYPSLYEGFGIPLLEAMALSCPVVCSNTSSFPEVVGDAAVFFDPNDEDSLGEAMEALIYSNELKKSLIRLGIERVKKFTWKKCASETAKRYDLVRRNEM